jgi:hypothetical protein
LGDGPGLVTRSTDSLVASRLPLYSVRRNGLLTRFLFEVFAMKQAFFRKVLLFKPLRFPFTCALTRREFAHLGDFLLNAGPMTVSRGTR